MKGIDMKLALTHKNGEVFEHFGKTSQFKIYEVEDGNIVSSKVIATMATGHDALSHLLDTFGVKVLLCGGIGPGAINALTKSGVEVLPGCSGNCDEIVEKYLNGSLVRAENFHAHHSNSCGC